MTHRGLLEGARREAANGACVRWTENAQDIITVAAPDGRLQYVSGGVTNTLGYTSEERHLHSIFDNHAPRGSGSPARKI